MKETQKEKYQNWEKDLEKLDSKEKTKNFTQEIEKKIEQKLKELESREAQNQKSNNIYTK